MPASGEEGVSNEAWAEATGETVESLREALEEGASAKQEMGEGGMVVMTRGSRPRPVCPRFGILGGRLLLLASTCFYLLLLVSAPSAAAAALLRVAAVLLICKGLLSGVEVLHRRAVFYFTSSGVEGANTFRCVADALRPANGKSNMLIHWVYNLSFSFSSSSSRCPSCVALSSFLAPNVTHILNHLGGGGGGGWASSPEQP